MRVLAAYFTGYSIGFRQNIELLFSILIIAILSAFAITIYSEYRFKAMVSQVTGYNSYLNANHVYHAITGEWPDTTENLMEFYHTGWALNDEIEDHYIKSISADMGAVNFIFKKNELEGKIMTLRPAVPSEDRFGPVIWICGEDDRGGTWTITGENRTNIDESYICSFLQ